MPKAVAGSHGDRGEELLSYVGVVWWWRVREMRGEVGILRGSGVTGLGFDGEWGLGAAGGLAWWSGGLLGRGPVGQGVCFLSFFSFVFCFLFSIYFLFYFILLIHVL